MISATIDWLIDFNGMSTSRGLFVVKESCSYLLYSFLKFCTRLYDTKYSYLIQNICYSYPIYPTPLLRQDMTQGQFLSGV